MNASIFISQTTSLMFRMNESIKEASHGEDNMCPGPIVELWKQQYDDHQLVSWIFEGVGLVFVAIYGVLLNCIAIAILRTKEVASFFTLLLVWLAIFDILFLVFSMFYHVTAFNRDILQSYWYANLFVYVLSPIRSIVMCCSIYMTVVLSWDRYRAVSNPTEYMILARRAPFGTWITSKCLMKYVGPIIIMSFIFYLPKFFDLKIGELQQAFELCNKKNKTQNDTNVSDCKSTQKKELFIEGTELRNNDQFVLWYVNVANFIVTVAIPLISLIYLNVRTYSKVLLFLRRQPSKVALEVSAAATERSKEIQQAYQLFAIVFLFVLCHALRVSLNIQEFINLRGKEKDNSEDECIPPDNYWSEAILPPISHFLLQFNSSLNFFVYSFLNKTFRTVLKDRFLPILKLIHPQKVFCCLKDDDQHIVDTNQVELQILTENKKFVCKHDIVNDVQGNHNNAIM